MKATVIIGDSRFLNEIEVNSVDLIITSPPYWQIKDYGTSDQIGYNQTLHEYLKDLHRVWSECYNVLKPGRRLCINIGDQFARSIIYGRYKIIPLHSECIAQCERIGLDYMGSIIWQKKTTMNTTGGATIMGSFPYPPNGMVEIDYEFVLIFKKPGESVKMPADVKEKSEITKEEWKEYFSGHWNFGGVKQLDHQAMFPDELPKRLIRMFSFYGETVLDPFLGSGTTMKVALSLNRNAMGYEINEAFLPVIQEKSGFSSNRLFSEHSITITHQIRPSKILRKEYDYIPGIQDAESKIDPKQLDFRNGGKYDKVVSLEEPDTLVMDTGLKVKLLGVKTNPEKQGLLRQYFRDFVLKKEVFLKFDTKHADSISRDAVVAYVYLKNKIFLNMYILKAKLGSIDESVEHHLKERFMKQAKAQEEKDG